MIFRTLVTFGLTLTLLANAASSQVIIPAPTPAAPAESKTDQMRRHLIGKWIMEGEYIGEDQIRHYTGITSTYKPDGTGIRVVVMEVGRVDGTGKQIKTGGKDEAIFYRVDPVDEKTFKLTQWTANSAPFYETWTILAADLMRMENGLELKRVR